MASLKQMKNAAAENILFPMAARCEYQADGLSNGEVGPAAWWAQELRLDR